MDKSKSMIAGGVGDRKINQTFNTSKSSHIKAGSLRCANVRSVQNFLLIWLNANIDKVNNNDPLNTISKLREIVNTVHIFSNVDECIDFISDIQEEKTFMISSGPIGKTVVPIIQDIAQVSAIYIISENKFQHEQWTQQWSKVKGVFTNITSICEALKQAAQQCDQNTMPMSFIAMSGDKANKNLDQLDQSFMYTQILKEILLTIDFEEQRIKEFITYCREQFDGNPTELKNINKLEQEYHNHVPTWWYTYPCFLYSMLNRALRLMEVDLLVSMGFYVQDLHNHISQLHLEQFARHTHPNCFTVYRGQGLTKTDFDQLIKTKDGLLSFNNFLSTSLDRSVSHAFAESIQYNSDLISVLFEITIDPLILSTSFANIRHVSYFQEEEEILFSMHSIFRIGNITKIDNKNNGLWQVELVLTSDNDPQLHALTEQIRKETFPHEKGWHRLGNFLIKVGQFDKAQQVCEIMLVQKSDDHDEANIYHMLGIIKDGQGEYAEAITYYEKALEIGQKTFPQNHLNLTTCYGNIGSVYNNMGEYSIALSYYEKALENEQKTLPPNHPDLATSFGNIGDAYDNMKEYSKALSYYEKALEIRQKALPPNHPHIATSYSTIGSVYNNMGEYSIALSYYEKALEIYQKTLPPNHPDMNISYSNIGLVYLNMGEYSKALSYNEKAFEIEQKTRPPNHPHLAISFGNIGRVYDEMGKHSIALSYYEKALEIFQKALPSNHPHLATSYGNIGSVYNNMGEYSIALSYYEKALEIEQKTLSQNHPDLAISYSNIGLLYSKTGKCSKALSYYEKALEIFQKTLPPNHPHLATSYGNIGRVYEKMGEHSIALSYNEKALEIFQKTLPSNHPNLASSYSNIGSIYSKMGEYSKALSYYEKALEIEQKILPPNHPDLTISYSNIGRVYDEMGEYSNALSHYEKALENEQKTLPPNHPDLAFFYNNIGSVYYEMGEYSKALSFFERTLDILQRSVSTDHPRLQSVRESIKIVKKKL